MSCFQEFQNVTLLEFLHKYSMMGTYPPNNPHRPPSKQRTAKILTNSPKSEQTEQLEHFERRTKPNTSFCWNKTEQFVLSENAQNLILSEQSDHRTCRTPHANVLWSTGEGLEYSQEFKFKIFPLKNVRLRNIFYLK